MRLKLEPRSSFTAALTLMLTILSLGVGRAAPKVTLETVCDDVVVLQTNYAADSFANSCDLLESTLRQALINSEIPLADTVRPRLTIQSTVSPPGNLPFIASTPAPVLACSIREFVRQFATTWKVAVTITGDQILFSKPPAKPTAAP